MTPGSGCRSCNLPVSVFAGRHDGIAPPEAQRLLAGRIPNAGFRVFEGGHLFVQQDRAAPQAVIDALSGHDEGRLAAGS